MRTKQIIAVIVIGILGVGLFLFLALRNSSVSRPTSIEPVKTKDYTPEHKVIGLSVEGRQIEAYTYLSQKQTDGNGKRHLVFVGGIHGGYEWNSVLLAYKFMDYLNAKPEVIPANLAVTVIPSANPDGLYKIIGKEGRFTITDVPTDVSAEPGRFNAHEVDLNRNFDCKWKPKSTWRGNAVNAGLAPFSEPETRAIRDFVSENSPDAVVFWHSQSNAVYASQCQAGILPETLVIMNVYSKASGYPTIKTFDAYATTGAADDWLASINIPAITVELKTHETVEWEQNLAGINALFKYLEY